MPGTFPNRQHIEARQLEQLRRLLGTIVPANRFYTEKFRAAGFDAQVKSLEDFRARCPFTTKAELAADQRDHLPFGSNFTYPLEQYTRCHQTSGTLGSPIRWFDEPESWKWMVGNWKRIFDAAGVTPADRVLFAFSFGPFIGFWLAFEAASEIGCVCFPGGGLSSVTRLKLLLECGVTVICCTPTYGLRLAEVAVHEKVSLQNSRVRLLVVAGEPGGSVPAARAQLQKRWNGARVFDHHGMTEVGPVSYECPARAGILHVIEEGYLAEIIDPATHQRVAVGQPGELVLTPLGRIGCPVLRYRTGDLVKAAVQPVCACGTSDLALEGGILSRIDDMVVVRGVNVYPSAVDEIIRTNGAITEYRVTVDSSRSLPELRIEIEVGDPGSAPAAREELEKALHRSFALRVPVECVPDNTLPRFELKARRWVRVERDER
jgi:phenylacetate-CoA ligase